MDPARSDGMALCPFCGAYFPAKDLYADHYRMEHKGMRLSQEQVVELPE